MQGDEGDLCLGSFVAALLSQRALLLQPIISPPAVYPSASNVKPTISSNPAAPRPGSFIPPSTVGAKRTADVGESLNVPLQSKRPHAAGLYRPPQTVLQPTSEANNNGFVTGRTEAIAAAIRNGKPPPFSSTTSRDDNPASKYRPPFSGREGDVQVPAQAASGGVGEGGKAPSVVTENPNISWDSIAGLESVKDTLKQVVVMPIKFPQLFVGNRKPWKGILFYGPPGTGKTQLARAVATELITQGEEKDKSACFFSVSSSDLMSKWQGEGEKNIAALFAKARESKPSVVFIDEIDSIGGKRGDDEQGAAGRRVLTEILQQMDGCGKGDMTGVLVLGATNKPYSLDEALRRRFQKRVYIPLPDTVARAYMFKLYLGPARDKDGVLLHTLVDADFEALAASTQLFSGSDISTACTAITNYPLTVCTSAKFWRPDGSGKYYPMPLEESCETGMSDPPHSSSEEDIRLSACRHPAHPSTSVQPRFVPPQLPLPGGQKLSQPLCPACKCVYIDSMYNWSTEQVGVPPFTFLDCKRVLSHTRGSVGAKQLEEYES